MKVFLSLLTVYTYPSERGRVPLNRQEAAKFLDALEEAPAPDRMLIISDVSQCEFEERARGLTEAERRDFEMVRRAIERRTGRGVDWVRVDLLDYRGVKARTLEALRLLLGGVKAKVDIHANLGCGRKVASVAVYVALMELAHSDPFYGRMRRCGFRVRPYQVEEGKVTEFPVLPVRSISVDMEDAMDMLMAVEEGANLDALKSATNLSQREFDRALSHLRKFGYVDFNAGAIRPTEKGRTILRVWKALKG